MEPDDRGGEAGSQEEDSEEQEEDDTELVPDCGSWLEMTKFFI